VDNLRIYKKGLHLVVEVYMLLKTNTSLQRDYSLCDQIKRASVSVSANIAEGYYRSRKQSKNYLQISSGSANEVVTLLRIIQLVYKVNTEKLQSEFILLGKQINSFSSSFGED